MYYQYDEKANRTQVKQIDPEAVTFGIITLEELLANSSELDFGEAAIAECMAPDDTFRGSVDDYGGYSFGMLSIVNTENILGDRDKIGFFIRRNLFLLVDAQDSDRSTYTLFEDVAGRIKGTDISVEKLIFTFFDRLLSGDFKTIEKMEYEIATMEEEIGSSGNTTRFLSELVAAKKKVLLLRNYYEQIIDNSEALEENDNGLFKEENLRYFRLIDGRATRLSGNVQYMRDSLVQLREAYDASVDISLNNIMKIFTVVTTIFLPLTLIVGWYGMNFTTMPELTWKYGYLSVILLSVAVVAVCIYIFKKKKLI